MATRFTIVLVGLVLAVTAGWGLSATIDSVTRPATPPQASLSTSIGLGERTTTELTRLREAVERLAATGDGREAVETRLTLAAGLLDELRSRPGAGGLDRVDPPAGAVDTPEGNEALRQWTLAAWNDVDAWLDEQREILVEASATATADALRRLAAFASVIGAGSLMVAGYGAVAVVAWPDSTRTGGVRRGVTAAWRRLTGPAAVALVRQIGFAASGMATPDTLAAHPGREPRASLDQAA